MKPIIGVTAELATNKISLNESYLNALLKAGAIPVVLPYTEEMTQICEIIARLDGLLLTGGADVDPLWFGEEPLPGLQKVEPMRDRFERELILEALGKNLPIFAICRGNQMLNVAAGGTLYQDLFSQEKVLQHHQNAPRSHRSHFVSIHNGTKLSHLLTVDRLRVNSFHHQAVKEPAPGFQIAATASDGTIEAIESTEHHFVVGVQWHPGDLIDEDANQRQLFRSFVASCVQLVSTPTVP